MKIQLSANAVVIGSKALNQKNPKAAAAAVTAPKGKAKMLEVHLTDDNGNDCVFTFPLRSYKGGSFGSFITMKGEAKILTVDATVKVDKDDAKLADLTAELLG